MKDSVAYACCVGLHSLLFALTAFSNYYLFLYFRISPPAEFCTSTFGKTPDSHLFPLASANKATSVKVTLLHLPRLPEIPKPLCNEVTGKTGKQRCSAVDCLASCFAPSSSPPWPLGLLLSQAAATQQQRSSSPKLDKPNVLHALSAEEREMLMRPSKCSCSECLGNSVKQCDVTATQLEQDPELKFPDDRLPRSSPDFFAEVSESPQSVVKDSKHLLLKLIPEEILATQHPHSPQHSKNSQMTGDDDAKTSSRKQSSLKLSVSTLVQPPFMDEGSDDLIAEVLPSNCLILDGGDSSSSSPDFDHFLSKTLMKQSEPLTLDEMEKYLYHLYLPNSSDASRSSAIGAYGTAVRSGRLKPRHSLDGKSLSSVLSEDDSAEAKLPLNLPEENKDFGAENLNFKTEPNSSRLFLRTQANAVTKISPIDSAKDGIGTLSLVPELTEKSRRAAPPCDDKTDSWHPVFTVGDPAENEKRAERRETAIASPVTPGHRVSASEEEDRSHSAIVHGDDVNRVRQSPPQALRKSTSCPSKPAFRNGVNSLLRTVMKKELMAGQSATTSVCASFRSHLNLPMLFNY